MSGKKRKTVAKKAASTRRGPKGRPERLRKRDAPDKGRFGRALAKARKAKGWPQHRLAKAAGITQPHVCNVEKGTLGASEALKKRLARAVGMPLPGAKPSPKKTAAPSTKSKPRAKKKAVKRAPKVFAPVAVPTETPVETAAE